MITLRSKLSFILLVSTTILWALFMYFSVNYFERHEIKSNKAAINKLANAIVQLIAPNMELSDYAAIDKSVSRFFEDSHLEFLVIYDNHNKIVASKPNASNLLSENIKNHSGDDVFEMQGKVVYAINRVIYSDTLQSDLGKLYLGTNINPLFVTIDKIRLYYILFGLLLLVSEVVLIHLTSRNIASVIRNLIRCSADLITGKSHQVELKTNILEVKELIDSYNALSNDIQQYKAELEHSTRLSAIANTASQVAHDIRSPLAALKVIVGQLSSIPDEQRIILRSSVQRIDDIANDLARKKIEQQNADGTEIPKKINRELLSSLIEMIVTEKRIQYRDRAGINISFGLTTEAYGIFVRVAPPDLKRVLSNIINNAIEAMANKQGDITIDLCAQDNMSVITVADNGQGISPEVLPKLMQQGASFGKVEGSGLGLFHARETVQKWSGVLGLASTVGKGTTVTIKIPKAEAPSWFVPEIAIADDSHIVVLDDDQSIHEVWRGRFREAGLPKMSLLCFGSTAELVKWWNSGQTWSNILFLFDYELLGDEKTGLDVIEELGIQDRAILVTSHFEEDPIKERCKALGVKMVPKNLAGFVGIKQTSPAHETTSVSNKGVGGLGLGIRDLGAILIDDDPLIRRTWELAAGIKKKNLAVYETAEAFFADMPKFEKETPVYIDSNLGNGVKGERVAQMIHIKGFKNIYLATGSHPSEFPPMPWIKEVVGKMPRFL